MVGEGLVKTGIIPPKAGVFICYPKKLLSPFLKENRTNFCPLKRVRVETDLRNWPHFSYTEDLVSDQWSRYIADMGMVCRQVKLLPFDIYKLCTDKKHIMYLEYYNFFRYFT